jgi:hypothetical protein
MQHVLSINASLKAAHKEGVCVVTPCTAVQMLIPSDKTARCHDPYRHIWPYEPKTASRLFSVGTWHRAVLSQIMDVSEECAATLGTALPQKREEALPGNTASHVSSLWTSRPLLPGRNKTVGRLNNNLDTVTQHFGSTNTNASSASLRTSTQRYCCCCCIMWRTCCKPTHRIREKQLLPIRTLAKHNSRAVRGVRGLLPL